VDKLLRAKSLFASRPAVGTFVIVIAAVALWLLGILCWFLFLTEHGFRPGVATNFHQDWPQESHLVPGSDTYTVVLFAHPECPCTPASLAETERLRTLVGDSFHLIVVFADDPAFNLSQSRNFHQASAWKDAVLFRDTDGREIDLFGARTSGQVLIFDKDRRLLFKGGITESRGHEGDNDNLQRAISVCRSPASEVAVTPVYGCSLR
jgi:hypothetical protein